jgi:hypothetical protein
MFQHAVRTLKLRLKSPLEKWIHSKCRNDIQKGSACITLEPSLAMEILARHFASHALLQRAIGGRQSTIQQLLERTNFNFSFKSDLSSSEQSVMLVFLSPIVCNTSYMDIKRLYATFGMFLASLKSGIKTSRLSSGPPSPAVLIRVPSK